MGKKVTFTVHDCGCVEIDTPPSSDGWELVTVAWACLMAINDNVADPNIILLDGQDVLLDQITLIKRKHECTNNHIDPNVN